MSDYLIELAEALVRHMPNKDIDYWMDLMVNGDDKITEMAAKFLEEDKKRMDLPICYCGSIMKINKQHKNGGMDGSYCNWVLMCPRCGITKEFAADNFYGREYLPDEKAVINNWNMNREDKKRDKLQLNNSMLQS